MGVARRMVLLTKLGKMIPASRSLTARCAFKAVDQDIMTILAMCEGGMAGRRLRWRGLASVTGAVIPVVPVVPGWTAGADGRPAARGGEQPPARGV